MLNVILATMAFCVIFFKCLDYLAYVLLQNNNSLSSITWVDYHMGRCPTFWNYKYATDCIK